MVVHFEVENRKELVKALETLTNEKSKYLGVPSCAYQIGAFTLSKSGNLSWEENISDSEMETLLRELKEKGFTTKKEIFAERLNESTEQEIVSEPEKEVVDFTISMPMSLFTPENWENLNNLLIAKGKLIKKAFDLAQEPDVFEDDGKVSFPWFTAAPQDSKTIDTYSRFVCALCKLAREQKRVTSKAKEVANEKYAFRCFLLRLGFIGTEFKETRKVLLKNFKGSSAFKGGAKNAIPK